MNDEASLRNTLMYYAMGNADFTVQLHSAPGTFPNADEGYIFENYTQPGSSTRAEFFVKIMGTMAGTIHIAQIRSDVAAAMAPPLFGYLFKLDNLNLNLGRPFFFAVFIFEEASRERRHVIIQDEKFQKRNK